MNKEINENVIVTLLKELYKLEEKYNFKCILNSTLLEYNLAMFRNEKHLIEILNEYHIDAIDIVTHPTEFRLETRNITAVEIKENIITLTMKDNKDIRIKLQDKK